MLVIRDHQLQAFARQLRQRFVEAEVQRLRAGGRDGGRGDVELGRWIEQALDRAAGFGVEQPADVRRLLDYFADYGLDFGQDPRTAWAGAILRTEGTSAGWKLNRLDEAEPFAPPP